MQKNIIGFSTLAIMLVAGSYVQADTMTLGASQDTTIFQNNPNNAGGGSPGLFAGTNGADSPRRALIEFNIAGNIPAGSTITSVQMILNLGQIAGSGGGTGMGTTASSTVDIFKVTDSWGEGTAQKPATPTDSLGGQGQGGTPTGNDATWNARFFDATNPVLWTTPGGDIVGTASASEVVNGTTIPSPYTWGSNAAMIADVQGWLDDPSTNFGWMLKNEDEVDPTDFRAFLSRDAADHNPQLVVTFTSVPEPSTIVLSLTALSMLLVTRRRCQG
jgi:hypothetical protein